MLCMNKFNLKSHASLCVFLSEIYRGEGKRERERGRGREREREGKREREKRKKERKSNVEWASRLKVICFKYFSTGPQ